MQLEDSVVKLKALNKNLQMKIQLSESYVKEFADVIKENDELRVVIKEFKANQGKNEKGIFGELVKRMSGALLNKKANSLSNTLNDKDLLMIQYLRDK